MNECVNVRSGACVFGVNQGLLLTLQLEDAFGGKDVRNIDAADGENIVTTDTAGLVSAAADTDIMAVIEITDIDVIIEENTYFVIVADKTSTYQMNTINNCEELYKHQQRICQTSFIK